MHETELIQVISDHSNKYGDKLLEFMGIYKLTGLREATAEQLKEYVETFISRKVVNENDTRRSGKRTY